jgi:hypothetical protein
VNDPLGFVLTTIRDNPSVAALTTRIRGGEPAGGTDAVPGDARGPGKYVRFVVLVHLGHTREPAAPVLRTRIGARCYGTTFADAALLAGAVSDAIHNVGPITNPGGTGIWRMYDDVGMGAEVDPDTKQPHQDLVIEVVHSTQPVVWPIA